MVGRSSCPQFPIPRVTDSVSLLRVERVARTNDVPLPVGGNDGEKGEEVEMQHIPTNKVIYIEFPLYCSNNRILL